jgi:hypothetical protein
MRILWSAIVFALICASAKAAESPFAIYDRDPAHLWNRLYRAMAVRTEAGVEYGIDNSEPYQDSFDDPKTLTVVLDEFLKRQGEDRAPGALRRALLLNDVWAAFDLATGPEAGANGASLRRRLARVIGQLRLQSSQIADLPDNYAQAVKSGTFAADFDPGRPDLAFLPPDLLDTNGRWVEIGEDGLGAVTPFHLQMLSGRSVFRVFIRCPGGRDATLSYLDSLNLYPTPWGFKPAAIATRTYPRPSKERWNPLRLDRATPQLPQGTIVALVRQMMVINGQLKPSPTSVTQKVQFRVFKDLSKPGGLPGGEQDNGKFNNQQLVFEFVMRRRDLLAAEVGGLHHVTQNEAEYQLTTVFEGGSRETHLRGPVVLATCVRCHSLSGIFSVNTYSGSINGGIPSPFLKSNPQLLPATSVGYQGNATADWKTNQFDWGLLRGLLEADAQAPPPH